MDFDIRDRITKVAQARLGDFESHPLNPKFHPDEQRQLVGSLMREIGWVGALLAWKSERAGGKWVCLDAHLRKDLAPDFEGWVLYTDLTDAEADLMVALYDESGRLAQIEPDKLKALQERIEESELVIDQPLFRSALEKMKLRGLENEPNGADAPVEFTEYDGGIETENTCPSCGYEW